jgi:hypothetical protein
VNADGVVGGGALRLISSVEGGLSPHVFCAFTESVPDEALVAKSIETVAPLVVRIASLPLYDHS